MLPGKTQTAVCEATDSDKSESRIVGFNKCIPIIQLILRDPHWLKLSLTIHVIFSDCILWQNMLSADEADII